jgi:HSP20 family protein
MITQMTKPEIKNRLKTPLDLFQEITRDWELTYLPNLFSRFHRPDTEMTWAPKMNVFEKDGELVVKADLPGVEKENVKVYMEESYLVIQGERRLEKEVKEDNFYRSECEYGTFYRRLPLNFEVDPGLIKATFTNGVLELKVPILAPKGPEPKQIPIT